MQFGAPTNICVKKLGTSNTENFDLNNFRYDFVLDAKEKSGVYQMRFGGLYDCSNLKAHGLGLLIYDNIMTDLVIFIFFTGIINFVAVFQE